MTLHEEILDKYSFDGGKGEDLIYAADLPEIIAKVREHYGCDDESLADAYNEGAANGKAKTIQRVLAAVEHDCSLFGEWMRFTPDEVIEVCRAAIKGVSDELPVQEEQALTYGQPREGFDGES